MKWPHLLLLAAFTLSISACSLETDRSYAPEFGQAPDSKVQEYTFAALPVHNPTHLFKVYGPLVDYLNMHAKSARFQLLASRSFADFELNIASRRYHFALPNPYETVKAIRRGYRVFGKMGDDETFRGVILVRRDSSIHDLEDLRGKTISFPAPTALAAALMPQYFLHHHGIDVNRDIKSLYSGSHDSTIMNVYLGNAAAGAVWLPLWQAFIKNNPVVASQLEVRWQTDTLPNNGLVVRDDVPDAVAAEVRDILLSMHKNKEGRAILAQIGVSHFDPADDKTYDPVSEFVRKFSREVRPIELEEK